VYSSHYRCDQLHEGAEVSTLHVDTIHELTDPDALAGLDLERDVVQDDRPVRGISGREVLDAERAGRRPVRWRRAFLRRLWLLLDLEVGLNALQAVALDLEHVPNADYTENLATEAD
jgi:hypothetical protein